MTPSRRERECSEPMAPSRSTSTSSWAATSGWTRYRRLCSPSSSRTARSIPRVAAPTPPTTRASWRRFPASRRHLSPIPGVTPSRPARRGRAPAGIVLPVPYPENEHIWNQYTLRIPGGGRRDALKALLTERKIGAEIYYPVPLHKQECFAHLPSAKETLPAAERLSAECLSIPIYPELTRPQQDEVIGAIQDFVSH